MRWCLLPSPLTNPAVADPLATALEHGGHHVVVADQAGSDVAAVLDGFTAAAAEADVVVAHSNAGRFGPAVAAAVGARFMGLDCLLPGDVPDAELEAFLRAREEPDGLLAPWSTWWPPAALEEVVGEHADVVTTAEPRVPLRLLLEQPPAPPDWLDRRGGYVALGDGYAEQAATVSSSGWPVVRLEGGHLHLLVAPDEVAAALLEVLDRLG